MAAFLNPTPPHPTPKVMADELTEDEIGDLKATFEAIDTDGSGSLSIAELNEALKGANSQMQATIEVLMAGIDFDGDQELDYQEFLAGEFSTSEFGSVACLFSFQHLNVNRHQPCKARFRAQ